jgi:D-3-phosphoglycerate dehydrogenase / 2-oxoglutarate reductase
MPNVLVADVLSEKGLALLRGIPGLEIVYEPHLNEDELRHKIKGFQALIVRSGTAMTEDVLASANQLSVIARAGIGLHNIDVAAASKRGIVVMNAPTGNAVATAEHTLALLLALSKRIPEADASLRGGSWSRERFIGRELSGRTLGIIGLGNVGRLVAERAVGLKMRVIAVDPLITAERAQSLGISLVTMEQVLRSSDVISVHTPLTPETRGLIRDETLPQLKRGVLLINTAVGGLFDEEALARGLREGRIGGVALDVFVDEPPKPDHSLFSLPNVIVTPHLGANTEEAQERVVGELADALVAFFTDGTVTNGVNVPNVSRELMGKIGPTVDLARRLGLFVATVWPHKPKAVEVELVGPVADGDSAAKAIVASAVGGVLARFVGAEVNQVAAPFLAQERGIAVREVRHAGPFGRYAMGVAVRLSASGGDSAVVRGTVGTDGSARLVGWNGFEVEAPLAGTTVVVTNQDRPGVIGTIGTIFGENFLNVARVTLGQRPSDRRSVSLWNLDMPVAKHVVAALTKAPHVELVTVVTLPKG